MPKFELGLKFDDDFGSVHYTCKLPLLNFSNAAAVTPTTDAAVRELRAALERDQETLKRLEVGGEGSGDVFLKRWLTAKRHDLNEAARCLQKHALWRANFVPTGRIHDNEVTDELATQKVFLQGCNNQGQALLMVLARRHDMHQRVFKQTEKLIVYTLDAACALADLAGGQRVCCMFDLSGLMLRNLDVKVLTTIFEILQQHYPERLGMIWFVNAPFIFWAVWRMVSPLIEERSRQKIKFVSCHEHRCSSFLENSVSMDVLPKCYGGQGALISIESASYQLFHQGITHPAQLTADATGRPITSSKESWKAWLKRHKKWMRVLSWVSTSGKAVVHNRFNRYFWTKCKALVWRRREQIHISVPPHLIRKQPTLTDFLNSERRPFWLPSLILKLVLLDIGLILVGRLRHALFDAISPQPICDHLL